MPIVTNRISAALLLFALAACTPVHETETTIERGRYLVKHSDCNSCHTEAFMEQADIPEQEWLKGSRRGWYNEFGTTYAANLRLLVSQTSEDQWVEKARSVFSKAPMLTAVRQEITDADLRAIYRYLAWLGPAGEPAPQALPQGVTPPEPYIYFPKIEH